MIKCHFQEVEDIVGRQENALPCNAICNHALI